MGSIPIPEQEQGPQEESNGKRFKVLQVQLRPKLILLAGSLLEVVGWAPLASLFLLVSEIMSLKMKSREYYFVSITFCWYLSFLKLFFRELSVSFDLWRLERTNQ
ncbi:hypothetical protein HAX54_025555 [Datura stramonium]|uniref:Uncharacterized protein n=1 Tax=Datura stramonium TaxID=4076 RepID=A0ABS8S7J2_DATST|nr:hypothetical protein [Datura stramonium]